MARGKNRVWKLFKRQKVRTRGGRPTLPRGLKKTMAFAARATVVLALLSALGLFGFSLYRFAFLSDHFEIKSLVITGVSTEIAEELRALTQLEADAGINLLTVNAREVGRTILKHPKIRSVRVNKHYPNALVIEAMERVPVAVVASGALYLVDRQGYVLDMVKNLSLEQRGFPFITGIERRMIAFGEPITTSAISNALDLFECLNRKNENLAGQLSEIRVEEDDSLTLVLTGGVEVRLGSQDFARRLAKLEFMTRELEDFDTLDYIDLRFEDQIVYRPRNG